MVILLLSAAALIVQLFLFLCAGSIVMKIRGHQDYALGKAALLGYFVWFGIFEVICLACEITLLPLRTLSVIMAAVAGATILLGLFSGYSSWIQSSNSLRYRLKLHGPTVWLLLLSPLRKRSRTLLLKSSRPSRQRRRKRSWRSRP